MKITRFYKILIIALLVITALGFVLLASSCKHVHDYQKTSEIPSACDKKGSITFTCECGESYTVETDTVNHKLVYASDEDFHWQECENCAYATAKTAHAYLTVEIDKSEPSTCLNAGYEVKSCVCGKEQKTDLPVQNHQMTVYVSQGTKHLYKCANCDYSEIQSHVFNKYVADKSYAPSCDKAGREVYACVCGEESVTELSAKHSLDYVQSSYGHFLQCSLCTYKTEETECQYKKFIAEKYVEPTCSSEGREVKACACGKENVTVLPLASHKYTKFVTDGTEYHWLVCSFCDAKKENSESLHVTEDLVSYVEGDCLHYAVFTYHCTECDKDIDYPDEASGYGAHKPKEFEAREPTDTQDGNIRYWQCQLCERYFTGAGCEDKNELLWEDIVISCKVTKVESFKQLVEAGAGLEVNGTSEKVYRIEADFCDVDDSDLMLTDDLGEIFFANIPNNADVSSLCQGDRLTLDVRVFKLSESGDDTIKLVDVVLVSVKQVASPSEKFSLTINCKLENRVTYAGLVTARVDGQSYGNNYAENYMYANVLSKGDKIYFECTVYSYGNVEPLVKSVIINGKSYRLITGRTEEITVTGDIIAEFVFAEYTERSVTIRPIDASQFNTLIAADEYVSYSYNGKTNGFGRLYSCSRTRFYFENAFISRVKIEYEDYESNDYSMTEVAKNIIYVGTDSDSYYKTETPYSVEGLTATINISGEQTYFEYYANVSQARIKSITFYYNTNNSL